MQGYKQKESLCERPHPVLTTLATPGPKEKTAKAKQIQQRKHASGWVNNDVGQITINSLTLYGYGAESKKPFNDLLYRQVNCVISTI